MFGSAKQKIDRAEYHIADLERQFSIFVREKPHRFAVQSDPKTGEITVAVRFVKEMPEPFSLIIGDAIHNLRCALDHMTWELVRIDEGTQDRYLKFPTGIDRVSFESACDGIKTPGDWVRDALKATQAFKGGQGDNLYQVHALDNADKHTAITPSLRATGHPPFSVYRADGILLTKVENNVIVGGFERVQFGTFPPGCSVELNEDAECPPSIFIHHPEFGPPRPAIWMLQAFAQTVGTTIKKIAKAVADC